MIYTVDITVMLVRLDTVSDELLSSRDQPGVSEPREQAPLFPRLLLFELIIVSSARRPPLILSIPPAVMMDRASADLSVQLLLVLQ